MCAKFHPMVRVCPQSQGKAPVGLGLELPGIEKGVPTHGREPNWIVFKVS